MALSLYSPIVDIRKDSVSPWSNENIKFTTEAWCNHFWTDTTTNILSKPTWHIPTQCNSCTKEQEGRPLAALLRPNCNLSYNTIISFHQQILQVGNICNHPILIYWMVRVVDDHSFRKLSTAGSNIFWDLAECIYNHPAVYYHHWRFDWIFPHALFSLLRN